MLDTIIIPVTQMDTAVKQSNDSKWAGRSDMSLANMLCKQHERGYAQAASIASAPRTPRKSLLVNATSNVATPKSLREALEKASSEQLQQCAFDFAEQALQTPKSTRGILTIKSKDDSPPKTPQRAWKTSLPKTRSSRHGKKADDLLHSSFSHSSAQDRRLSGLRSRDALGRCSHSFKPTTPTTPSRRRASTGSSTTMSNYDRALRLPQRKNSMDADSGVLRIPKAPSPRRRIRRRSNSSCEDEHEKDDQIRKAIAARLKVEGIDDDDDDCLEEKSLSCVHTKKPDGKRARGEEKKVDRKARLPTRKPSFTEVPPQVITTSNEVSMNVQ